MKLKTVLVTVTGLLLLAACSIPPKAVTLALLGDINLGRGVSPAPGSLAFLTPDLRAADLAIANLESPLTGRGDQPVAPTQGYNLCAPADRARNLADWGLKLVSLANNHDLDCGRDGLVATRSALESAGLTPVGPGFTPVTASVRGLRLAFLAFDDVSAPLDVEAALEAVRTARATGALVVVGIHWGNEYQAGADDRQKSLAQRFAGAGAALIWGTHPHVLQPAGWIEAGGSKTLVLYSLGNALFDQYGLADTRRSALVTVTLDGRGVQSVRVVPFVIDAARSRVAAPDDATAEIILDRINLP